jgi:Uma2 family endonuclease
MAATSAPSVVWDEFVALDEADRRELVDGALVELEVPGLHHEEVVAAIVQWLRSWARTAGAGTVLASGYKVRISDRRGVRPDVQLIRRERLPSADPEGFRRGAPDLVVEVVSPSSRRYDRVVKLRWYAEIRVPEYWIVDPEDRTLERLVLGKDGRYVIADSLEGNAVFEPPSCPGLSIPMTDVWGDAP